MSKTDFSKMDLPTLIAIAFDVDTGSVVSLPEVDCSACQYNDMPHEGGHCYMFQDPPEDNRCGAFEDKQYRMRWK